MADGDYDVRTTFRSFLPGAGYNVNSGVAANKKTMVVGDFDFTYNTNGLVVNPADVGLTTIDALFITQVAVNNDTQSTAAQPWYGHYISTTSLLLFTDDAGTEATDSQTGTCKFVAFGDSAATADLT